MDESRGTISAALAFWHHQFDPDTVNGFLKTYMAILDLILQDPDTTVPKVLAALGKYMAISQSH